MVNFHQAFDGKRLYGGTRYFGPFGQHVERHFDQGSVFVVEVREGKDSHKCRFLCRRAFHCLERCLEDTAVVAGYDRTHIVALAGAITLDKFFRYYDETFRHEPRDGLCQRTGRTFGLKGMDCDGAFFAYCGQQFELFGRAGGYGFVVGIGIDGHACLAFQLEPGGERCFVDFAHGAQKVVGHPLPETYLRVADYRLWVEHRYYLFERRAALRGCRSDGGDYAGVVMAHTERHYDTAAGVHAVGESGRNNIREGAVDRERHNHLCEKRRFFVHTDSEVTNFLRNSMSGA